MRGFLGKLDLSRKHISEHEENLAFLLLCGPKKLVNSLKTTVYYCMAREEF